MSEAVAYDPFSKEAMTDPYPLYRALREAGPIHPLPQYDAFALPRFAEVWQVLEDLESFSVAEGPVFSERPLSRPADLARLGGGDPNGSFSTWDPPLHSWIRQVMSAPFRPGRVRRLEPEVRRLAREGLEELVPRSGFDLVSDYAAPIAAMVSCRTLGFAAEEGPALVSIVRRMAQRDAGVSGQTRDGTDAHQQLLAFALDQIARRRARGVPEDPPSTMDLLLEAELDSERFTDLQLAIQLVSIVVGGTETVPKLVAGGLRQLWLAPDQRAQLVKSPELAGQAFEETIRHQGVLQSIGRTAMRPFEVGGRRIEPGQRVFLLLQSANRDEREFPDAERFDIYRRPARHVGLGHGQHHCIGAHVARLEGQVLLEELLSRIPEYEIDESSAWRPPSEFQLGYSALRITF